MLIQVPKLIFSLSYFSSLLTNSERLQWSKIKSFYNLYKDYNILFLNLYIFFNNLLKISINLFYLTIFIYKMVLNGQKSLFLIIIWVCIKILTLRQTKIIRTERSDFFVCTLHFYFFVFHFSLYFRIILELRTRNEEWKIALDFMIF